MAERTESRTLIEEAELARFAGVAARYLNSPPTTGAKNITRQHSGHAYEFLDFRNYIPGDDIRRIDWKASARSQSLKTRTYTEDAGSDCFICLDQSSSMVLQNSRWSSAQKLVAALAYTFLYSGYRVSLLCFSSAMDDFVELGRGHFHYSRIIDRILNIPKMEGRKSEGLSACSNRLGRGEIFLVSDMLFANSIHNNLGLLRRLDSSVNLLQLAPTDDSNTTDAEFLTLVDCESLERRYVENSPRVRHLAEFSLREHRDQIAATARQMELLIQLSLIWRAGGLF